MTIKIPITDIIEYEDMTDMQKRIVDMGEAPAAGKVPTHLSDEELDEWILEQINNARNNIIKYDLPITDIIEYEDMTDTQKRIVDMGEEPAAGRVPPNLSKEELRLWIKEQINNAREKKNEKNI